MIRASAKRKTPINTRFLGVPYILLDSEMDNTQYNGLFICSPVYIKCHSIVKPYIVCLESMFSHYFKIVVN